MAPSQSLGERVGLVSITIIPLLLLGLMVIICKAIDKHQAKKQMVRDHKLADRGCCVLCGHLKDHSQCQCVHGNLIKFASPRRCVYCGQKENHGACATIAPRHSKRKGGVRPARAVVVSPPPVYLGV